MSSRQLANISQGGLFVAQRRYTVCVGNEGVEVGTLWVEEAGHREFSCFQYADSWLSDPRAFPVSPHMPLDGEKRFFRPDEAVMHSSSLPPPLADATPDSWGRGIMRLHERMAKDQHGLDEASFLTGVDDFSRLGALRIRDPENEDVFLETLEADSHPVPSVRTLKEIAHDVASMESGSPDLPAVERLRRFGTSMGGARPKCCVMDRDGRLALAKFTSRRDTYPVEKAEVLTLRLARLCGLKAPKARIEMAGRLPVAIIERFDRGPDGGRVLYISAQTALDVPSATSGTYVDLADFIREHASRPQDDLRELFSRVAFMILVSNVDDHLRNHGFLYTGSGRWELSPVFDVNPAPERLQKLKTSIAQEDEPDASIDLLMEHAFYFDLETDDAAARVASIAATIAGSWKQLAAEVGMTPGERKQYQPAFEPTDMKISSVIHQP